MQILIRLSNNRVIPQKNKPNLESPYRKQYSPLMQPNVHHNSISTNFSTGNSDGILMSGVF